MFENGAAQFGELILGDEAAAQEVVGLLDGDVLVELRRLVGEERLALEIGEHGRRNQDNDNQHADLNEEGNEEVCR